MMYRKVLRSITFHLERVCFPKRVISKVFGVRQTDKQTEDQTSWVVVNGDPSDLSFFFLKASIWFWGFLLLRKVEEMSGVFEEWRSFEINQATGLMVRTVQREHNSMVRLLLCVAKI